MLNKSTMIPVEESPAFKEPADRKAESVAHNMFTMTYGGEHAQLADQLVQGLQFVCDASLNLTPLFSKLSISAGVLRRVLWLRLRKKKL